VIVDKGKPAYTYRPGTVQRLRDLEIRQTSRRVLKQYEWTPPGQHEAIPVTVYRCYGVSQKDDKDYRWIMEAQHRFEYTNVLTYGLARCRQEDGSAVPD